MNYKDTTNLLRSLSDLSVEDILSIKNFFNGRQPFSIYFNSALADLQRGMDNRWMWFKQDKGCVIGIDFDDIRIFTLIGQVDSDVVDAIATNPKRTEIHVEAHHVAQISKTAAPRLIRKDRLKYYQLERCVLFEIAQKGIRRLDVRDLSVLQSFFRDNYNGTIFSEWMLENPFLGLFIDGNLVAAGGTIVVDKVGTAANIGNFLTRQDYRGRGFCQELAKSLINELIKEGIQTFTLGTTEENASAWRAYEAVGFRLIEVREELEMATLEKKKRVS